MTCGIASHCTLILLHVDMPSYSFSSVVCNFPFIHETHVIMSLCLLSNTNELRRFVIPTNPPIGNAFPWLMIELGSIKHQGCQWQRFLGISYQKKALSVCGDDCIMGWGGPQDITPRKSLQDVQTRADARRHLEVLVSIDRLGMREWKLYFLGRGW